MVEMRPYQVEAVASIYRYFAERKGDAPLIVAPTGSGKSLILSEFMRKAAQDYPGTRILLATHQKELIEQDYRALLRIWPDAPAGIYSAGLNKRQARAQLLFAGVQSIHRKAREIGHVDLMGVDEAHLLPRSADTQYGRLIDGLRAINPAMKIFGLTATPYRLDSGVLHRGDGAVFDGIAYDIPVAMLVQQGFLSPLVSKKPGTVFDTRGLHKRGGEFIDAEMMARFATEEVTEAAVAEIVALGENRRSWIAFCIGVDHAEIVRDALRRHGVSAEMVTGQTPAQERDRLLRRFKAGEIRCLTSIGVLTTGFDAPAVDLIAMLRPTASTGLYVQMAGRGMRIAPGKDDCIAEGQRVLTDRGLVPIERITRAMKVWDGVDFVDHCGTVFRGEREVIQYAGLEATPDHRVWTEEGWKALGQCAFEQAAVAVTGHGRTPIRSTEGRFRGGRSKERQGASAPVSRMLRVWSALAEGIHKLAQRYGRLPYLWQSPLCAEVARYACHNSEATVHQPKRRELSRLWGARNLLQFPVTNSHGSLGSGEPWPSSRDADRSDQQRRALRTGEPALPQRETEPGEQARPAINAEAARLSRGASGNPILGRDPSEAFDGRVDARTDCRSVQPAIGKTKRRVWDILNAGPRHSFTVEGLLVHNCLVLDFAGNVARHGPVDAIALPGDKKAGDGDGEAPAKVCPSCDSIILISARECPDCGHMFPEPEPKIEKTASTEAIMNLTAQENWEPVIDVSYSRHRKPGSPDSMRVDYLVGQGRKVVSEWVCLEHSGFARQKAVQWWERISGPGAPETIDEAMARLGELRKPDEAVLTREGKYHRIKRFRFTKVEAAA